MADTTQEIRDGNPSGANAVRLDLKLEVVVIPVSDVDRAKSFYQKLGFRLDIDFAANENYRILQFTPPGSPASIIFGKGVTAAKPGSIDRLVMAVSDIAAARKELLSRGAAVSEVFHGAGGSGGGGFHSGTESRAPGPDPQGRSYDTFASFSDPDGNVWLLQQITSRLPGRIDTGVTSFSSASDLAAAMRRASAAHGEHEKRIGAADPNWPDWYAEYMVREQSGGPLPQ
jgi:catechol 2,3-dioxygenase-like lactoylglutathione lyase family enzyme